MEGERTSQTTRRYAKHVMQGVVISRLVVIAFAAAALACGSLSGCGGFGDIPTDTAADTVTVSTTEAGTTTNSGVTSTSTTTTDLPTVPATPAETILQGMTLREKAAQVLLLAFEGTTVTPAVEELLTESPPGGLLLLGRNVTGAAQLGSLTTALQEAAAVGGSQVGLFIAVDQEGGSVQRVRDGVPAMPSARSLGTDSSPAEAAGLAAETAAGLLALGVNVNLAPVADVVSDPESFLYSRTYGGDPTVVAAFVEAVTNAYVQKGLIAVPKHFPGHGSAPGDTHGEPVISEVTQADFATTHLPPFKAALTAGAECIMMSHVVATAYDPERPASLSPQVVNGLLRKGLGFSGVVVADDLEMAAALLDNMDDPGEAAVLALLAGCDLLISSGTLTRQQAMIEAIAVSVQTGRLSEDRLDEAVLRVLNLKLRHDITVP